MSTLDKYDKLAEFRPFYDQATTQRLLTTYYQVPHTFDESLKNQLFEHAVHFKIPIEDEKKTAPVSYTHLTLPTIYSV